MKEKYSLTILLIAAVKLLSLTANAQYQTLKKVFNY